MSVKVPKVKFEVIEFGGMFRLINGFLSGGTYDWSDYVYSQLPGLRKVREKYGDDKEARYQASRAFLRKKYDEALPELREDVERFQKSWDKINDAYMQALSEVLEIPWNKADVDKGIVGRVSMNPICPRFIKPRVFDAHYLFTNDKMREVAAHEIQHFLYFEKWKELFPETDEKEFDTPHLVWHLSEIAAPAILGDPRIQKVIPRRDLKGYKEHRALMVDGKSVVDRVQEIYDSRKDIADFMRRSYELVKSHKDKLKGSK